MFNTITTETNKNLFKAKLKHLPRKDCIKYYNAQESQYVNIDFLANLKFNRFTFTGMPSIVDILEDKKMSQEFIAQNISNNKPALGSPQNVNLLFWKGK